MPTTFPKHETYTPAWYIVSAKNQVLGRLSTRIAVALMGKTRPSFAPSVDNGDFVVVTDVEALAVTGRKATDKVYRFHTGYFGGLNEIPFATMLAKRPDDILRLAVQRMLPKTIIGRHMIARLKIYKGSAHPHQGQHPVALPGN